MWFIGVEVEQETVHPLLKKILDAPLSIRTFYLFAMIFVWKTVAGS